MSVQFDQKKSAVVRKIEKVKPYHIYIFYMLK